MMSFGMYGMNSMMGMSGSSGNVYQNMKQQYGCGHADFSDRPYVAGYPMPAVPKAPDPITERTWLGRLYNKLYS